MKSLVTRMIYFSMFILLAACGGGSSGGSPSSIDNPPPTNSSSSTIKLAKSVLQMNETTTVTAKFVDANGNPAAGITTTFSTSLGTLNPANGQVVTDTTGTASAQLVMGTVTGSGIVTANALVAGRQVSKTASFSVNLPPLKLSNPTLGLTTLSYAGSTSVSVSILDANGASYTAQDVDVMFTSTQTVAGKATLPQTVRSVNGVASATYKANTVVGTDTISIALGDSVVQTSLTVNPADASSIQYVSAVPVNIGLKGMGGAGIMETSTVTFRVLDVYGQPRANQQVNFKLNSEVGGLKLVASSGSTASDGTVSTIVQAGTIATPVRVTASLSNGLLAPTISTQSDQLVVSTGIPAQDGFSISMSKLNTESFSYDGVESQITARLSDHFHNPVPDGTAVYFTTSGGAVQPSCTTVAGTCTVIWRSQNPRPSNGRAVILAYSVGEEAFVDLNGNGVADPGEFTDTTGAFRDDNENKMWDSVAEPPIPFFNSSGYDPADGKYNGVLQGSVYAGAPKSKHVFSNLVHVMGGSRVGSLIPSTKTLDPAYGSTSSKNLITFTLKDLNGNAMPAGTKVSIPSVSPLDVNDSSAFVYEFVVPDSTSKDGSVFSTTIANYSSYTSEVSVIARVTTPNNNSDDIAITFSWTGVDLNVSPSKLSFSSSAKQNDTAKANIYGGKPLFKIKSNTAPSDLEAKVESDLDNFIVKVTLLNNAPTVVAPAVPVQKNADIIIEDAKGVTYTLKVSYY